MKTVVDRIVQYPNRYKLTNAETGEVLGTFDFDEVTGTVEQVGTEIDAELFKNFAQIDGNYPSLMAGGVVAGQGAKSDNLDDFKGSAYYGKSYYWIGGQTPSNAPSGANGGILFIQRCGGGSVAQTFITNRSTNGTTPPVVYQRSQSSTGAWSDWEEIVTSDGSYPTLGAGYLAKQININQSQIGWVEVAAIDTSKFSTKGNYSCIMLVNGVLDAQGRGSAAESGLIEIDVREVDNNTIVAYSITVLAGNINTEEWAIINDNDTIKVYLNLPAMYQRYLLVVLSEGYQTQLNVNFIELTNTFYGTTAPANAVYAVVRNIASYVEVAKSAETLSRGVEISIGSGEPGWYKFMEASGLAVGHGYSAIILVNGVLHTQGSTSMNVEESGIIEVDYYNEGGVATRYGVSILAGNLVPEEFCITASGNSISVYKNLAYAYEKAKFTELSLSGTNATTTYGSELESAAPANAVYAVVRNNASADDNGYSFDTNYVWHNNGQVEVNTLKDGTTSLDFNDYLEEGKYELQGNADNTVVNFPTSSLNSSATNCDWYLVVYARGSSYVTQVAYSVRADNAISIRSRDNGEWREWRLLFEDGVAQSIPTASETVIGGAKMWVSNGKLYIKTI